MSVITEKRIAKGMTLADLARAVGVTPAAVTFWEQGVNKPSLGKLIKLAELFDCTVDELLGRGETHQEGGEKDAGDEAQQDAV